MAQNLSGWHTEDIKAEIRKKFGSVSNLCANWGLHPSAISNTIRRPFNSMRVERRIGDALGVPLHEIWPDRWKPDGTPLPRSIGMNPNGPYSVAERQKKAAA